MSLQRHPITKHHDLRASQYCTVTLVLFPDPALQEDKGLVHISASGACFWILTHQSDSRHVAYNMIPCYSQLLLRMRAVGVLPYQNDALSWQSLHMTSCILCAPKPLNVYQMLSSLRAGSGGGDETTVPLACHILLMSIVLTINQATLPETGNWKDMGSLSSSQIWEHYLGWARNFLHWCVSLVPSESRSLLGLDSCSRASGCISHVRLKFSFLLSSETQAMSPGATESKVVAPSRWSCKAYKLYGSAGQYSLGKSMFAQPKWSHLLGSKLFVLSLIVKMLLPMDCQLACLLLPWRRLQYSSRNCRQEYYYSILPVLV